MPAPRLQFHKVGFSPRESAMLVLLHGTVLPALRDLIKAGFTARQAAVLRTTTPATTGDPAAVPPVPATPAILPALEILVRQAKFTRRQAEVTRKP